MTTYRWPGFINLISETAKTESGPVAQSDRAPDS